MASIAPSPAHVAPAQPVSGDLCWLLSRASYVLSTELTAAFEGVGLSPRAHMVLSTALGGELTQGEIARRVGLDKTTMVVTVDELEKAGLAERRPSRHDRRARVIAVTDAGRQKVHEAEEIAARIRADVLGVLGDEEREVFLGALSRLVGERLAEPVECVQAPRRRGQRG
jgi:DNA-binding MarR family transcriptional regulator